MARGPGITGISVRIAEKWYALAGKTTEGTRVTQFTDASLDLVDRAGARGFRLVDATAY